MATPNPPRPAPVLSQRSRVVTPLAIEARARQVLQNSRSPAQLSLFSRPSANDPK